jgi:hypothetical protein
VVGGWNQVLVQPPSPVLTGRASSRTPVLTGRAASRTPVPTGRAARCQAYQFDTLPLAADDAEHLQPGDLVFISGRYFDASRSRKPHDMTHVEIYFPRGPARTQTIGSRHKSGCVQVHRDFRFESKTYHSMRYHFRRIDTWLDGTCQSHCKEHRWVNG